MNKLIYKSAAFFLAIASLAPSAWATGKPGDVKFSHLVSSAAYPNTARVPDATHQFEVHIQEQALSELLIDLPEDINISKGIDVTNESGQTIPTTVSINGRKATVVFPQPVPPETTLSVSMEGVRTPGYANTWLYQVYDKKVDLNAELPLGTVQITTYLD